MTVQEFVLNQAKIFADVEIGDRSKFISHRSVDEWNTSAEGFKNGLTKGLEIAEGFIKWAEPSGWHRHEVDGDTWFHFQTMEVKTTDELLSIYITENEKK